MCVLGDGIMLGFLMICAWSDWKHRSVPVWLLSLYSAAALLLALLVKRQNIGLMAAGILFGLLFFVISIVTKEAIGYGDSWIITVLGCYLGIELVVWMLLIGSLCASVVSLIQLCKNGWNRGYTLPFVPFITIGFAGVILS